MKNFTRTCIALAVICSINAYASNDELELVDDIGYIEGHHPTINISDKEIADLGKRLVRDTDKNNQPSNSENSSPVSPKDNTSSSELIDNTLETIDPTKEDERVTDANPTRVNNVKLNISDEEVRIEGKELKNEKGLSAENNITTIDPIPVEERITATNPPKADMKPTISDEEIKNAGKGELKKEGTPLPPLSAEIEESVPEVTDVAIKDIIPEKDRITADNPPKANMKPTISDEEIEKSGKTATFAFELPSQKAEIIAATSSIASSTTLAANVALSNIGSRLSSSRSGNNNSGLTASLANVLAPSAEKSGLWINTKYAKIQRYSTKAKNWGVQIGYDHPFELESAVLRLGMAVDLEKGKADIMKDRLNNNQYGVTLYGSYETESSHYVDFFIRAARSSFELTEASKFHNKNYSFALAYSKAFELSNSLSLEPHAQLSYSHVSSTHFVKNNYPVYLAPMNIMVGNIGLKTTANISNKLSSYGKIVLNKEFLGKAKGYVGSTYFAERSRATWTTIGLGLKSNISKDSSLYLEADTNLGNGYKNSYQLNLGVNIKF